MLMNGENSEDEINSYCIKRKSFVHYFWTSDGDNMGLVNCTAVVRIVAVLLCTLLAGWLVESL